MPAKKLSQYYADDYYDDGYSDEDEYWEDEEESLNDYDAPVSTKPKVWDFLTKL